MKNLYLKPTEETPEIILDREKPEFKMSGKSYMEDATAHYVKVIDWLKEYSRHPNKKTVFVFELEYVNTASSKIVNDILDILENMYLDGHDVSIEWHYFEEDEDMLELGKEYEEIYEVPFTFEEINYDRPDTLFEID